MSIRVLKSNYPEGDIHEIFPSHAAGAVSERKGQALKVLWAQRSLCLGFANCMVAKLDYGAQPLVIFLIRVLTSTSVLRQ